MNSFFIFVLGALSLTVGWVSRIQFPDPINRWLCSSFVSIFGIDMSEAELPLTSYKSIEEVFTRKLKDGLRPSAPLLASPADGSLSVSAAANNQKAVQVKGLSYDLNELISKPSDSQKENLSWYTTVYLAPHNYHRVHSPVSGELIQMTYVPGSLWPVNKLFVRFMPRLFNRNERLIFEIRLDNGGTVYTVMVGALNVGRIVSPFWPNFSTNAELLKLESAARLSLENAAAIKIGDELGTFMLGSTVVLVFNDKALEKFPAMRDDYPREIKVGEDLIKVADS